MKIAILVGATLLTASLANAATTIAVDFEELSSGQLITSPLVSGGLLFENHGTGMGDEAFFATDGFGSGVSLAPNYFSTTTTVSLNEGGIFNLISFDFADAFNFADDALKLTLTFDTINGTIVQQFTADYTIGLQTELSGVTGINAFTLLASDSFYDENAVVLDNIIYSIGNIATVPEPAAWGMMIAGFGLVGTMARRRTQGELTA